MTTLYLTWLACLQRFPSSGWEKDLCTPNHWGNVCVCTIIYVKKKPPPLAELFDDKATTSLNFFCSCRAREMTRWWIYWLFQFSFVPPANKVALPTKLIHWTVFHPTETPLQPVREAPLLFYAFFILLARLWLLNWMMRKVTSIDDAKDQRPHTRFMGPPQSIQFRSWFAPFARRD